MHDSSYILGTRSLNEFRNQVAAVPQQSDASGTPEGFSVDEGGVYFLDNDERIWLSSSVKVTAITRDEKNRSWGKLLEIRDMDDNIHIWAMPATMLEKDEYRKVLRSLGFSMASGKIAGKDAKARFYDYLNMARPEKRAVCVDNTGWHQNVFVLPEQTIGAQGDEQFIFQSDRIPEGLESEGTLESWQQNVSLYCKGNSRLILSMSTAFAAPLLYLANMENGGIHLQGSSSLGKTTALHCANSIYGGIAFMQSWRATDNGLEGTAFERNDLLLCLDEINQVDPQKAGDIAYMLANGKGKKRANQDGSAKSSYKWRTLFISTGELDLAAQMSKAGQSATAGQEIRLLQVSADAGAGLGLFEDIHGSGDGACFSRLLTTNAQKNYGTAGVALIEQLTRDEKVTAKIKSLMEEFQEKADIDSSVDGQVKRAAERFALIAAGGELATEYGITLWDKGEATRSALVCLRDWINRRGGTRSHEEMAALLQVRTFLQEHENRFKPMNKEDKVIDELSDPDHSRAVPNQVGFIRRSQGRTQYLCYPDLFAKVICKGINPKLAIKVLKQMGAITVRQSVRLTNFDPKVVQKLHIINEKVFVDEDSKEE